jgi:hypothetical protein
MEVFCREIALDTSNNLLFVKGRTYDGTATRAKSIEMIELKDEIGGYRRFPVEDIFFKQHFKIVKGQME